jgi:hypothetical protein
LNSNSNDEGFLGRWARRKQAVEDEAVTEVVSEQDAGAVVPEPQSDEEALAVLREQDPELAEQISAIDIDALTYDDDFTVFMNSKVPEFIRRKALSKLWLSSPVLANLDGLNEYDENFRNTGSVLEAVQTALSEAKEGAASPGIADEPVQPEKTSEEQVTKLDEDDIPEDDEDAASVNGSSSDRTEA